jgi:catalase-peroxidase
MDALESQTDVISFAVLEPKFDGFRNYSSRMDGKEEFHLVDKASLLTLSIPEMTVLVGGMRALGATYDNSNVGVLTEHPGTLTNDFFVNLLDNFIKWEPKDETHTVFEGIDTRTGKKRWRGSRVDLIFGAHSELRAVAEVYASSDGKKKFVEDFVASWAKVMDLDRFDLK